MSEAILNGVHVYVETVADNKTSTKGLVPSSGGFIGSKIEPVTDKMLDEAKKIIELIASNFPATEQSNISSADEICLSFGLGVKAEGDGWIIKAGGDVSVNIQMIWRRTI